MENVHLIVGLGNPGSEYTQTRHNSGFMAVELLAERRAVPWKQDGRFAARLARTDFEGRRVVLCEPQTFMNQSGTAVRAVTEFFKVPLDRLLIVVDDADLPLGGIRMRPGGSSGGHHGLESIEQHLGTRDYARLRIGIGRRVEGEREISGHVLGRFDGAERPLLRATLDRVCDQMERWLAAGVAAAMNEFNGTINTSVVKES
ncbi:MAG: aminoacyl-tRNA hydrolase [Verrucomicrobiota bacterium]